MDKKNNKPSEKEKQTVTKKSKNDIDSHYIHLNITVAEFHKRIKENPDSIWTDFDIKYAIKVLQDKSFNGTQTDSQNAKNILKKAGLEAFKPKGDRGRRRDNYTLIQYDQDPYLFLKNVMHIKNKIEPIWKKYRGESLDDRIEAALKVLKIPINEKLIRTLMDELDKVEHNTTIGDFTLAILAKYKNVKFDSLYDLYYRDKRVKEAKKMLRSNQKPKGRCLLNIDTKTNSNIPKVIKYEMIKYYPVLAVNIYEEAYMINTLHLGIARHFLPFLASPEEYNPRIKDLRKGKSLNKK